MLLSLLFVNFPGMGSCCSEDEDDVLEDMEGVDSGEANGRSVGMHQGSAPFLPLPLRQLSQEDDMVSGKPAPKRTAYIYMYVYMCLHYLQMTA